MNAITVCDNPDIRKNQISFEAREQELKAKEEAEAEARKREKQSPFSRWTQFNNDHTKELMMLAMNYPKAHAILYFLVDQMDQYNAVICSYDVLSQVFGKSRQTISKSVKMLEKMGFIAILKSGTSNVYTINDKVYWKSWGNNHKYSKFPANIVLSLDEQDEQYKQLNFDNMKGTKYKSITTEGGKQNA